MILSIPLNKITDNPWQTRQGLEPAYIAELAADIQRNGLLQNPVGRVKFETAVEKAILDAADIQKYAEVVPVDRAFTVQLAIGHNRVAAYRLLADGDPAYAAIPIRLVAYTDEEMARAAWSENAQRKDLSPVEEARAIERVIADFGWTQRQAAEKFGLNESTISNKLKILRTLPDEVLTKLHHRAISERQAAAIAEFYDLPAPAQQEIEKRGQQWHITPPKQLLEKAIRGESSDELRDAIRNTTESVTKPLSQAPWPLDRDVGRGHPAIHGHCAGCKLSIGRKDNDRRCADLTCYGKKHHYWRSYRLLLAQEKVNIPFLDEKDDEYTWRLESFAYSNQGAGKEIIAAGCPKGWLRLSYSPDNRNRGRDSGHYPPGFPDCRIVCSRHGGCACLKKHEKEHGKPMSDHERQRQESRDRYHRLVLNPAIDAFADALANIPAAAVPAWKAVVGAWMGQSGQHAEWRKVARAAADRLLSNKWYFDDGEPLADYRRRFDELLIPLGITIEWPVDVEATLDDVRHRWQRIQSWMPDEPGQTRPLPQINGNLLNIGRLLDEIAALPASDETYDLLRQLEAARYRLEKLSQNDPGGRRPTPPEGYVAYKDTGKCPACNLRSGFVWNASEWQSEEAAALKAEVERLDEEWWRNGREGLRPNGNSQEFVQWRDHWSRFSTGRCAACEALLWHDYGAPPHHYFKPD